jgi:hypothetical protein
MSFERSEGWFLRRTDARKSRFSQTSGWKSNQRTCAQRRDAGARIVACDPAGCRNVCGRTPSADLTSMREFVHQLGNKMQGNYSL